MNTKDIDIEEQKEDPSIVRYCSDGEDHSSNSIARPSLSPSSSNFARQQILTRMSLNQPSNLSDSKSQRNNAIPMGPIRIYAAISRQDTANISEDEYHDEFSGFAIGAP